MASLDWLRAKKWACGASHGAHSFQRLYRSLTVELALQRGCFFTGVIGFTHPARFRGAVLVIRNFSLLQYRCLPPSKRRESEVLEAPGRKTVPYRHFDRCFSGDYAVVLR